MLINQRLNTHLVLLSLELSFLVCKTHHTRVYKIRVFYTSHEGSSWMAITTELLLMDAGQYNAELPQKLFLSPGGNKNRDLFLYKTNKNC